MADRALYSIKEAREQLGGISRNSVYRLLNNGELASVIIGCRRFITADAIAQLIKKSATADSELSAVMLTKHSARNCTIVTPERCRRICSRITRITIGTVSSSSRAHASSETDVFLAACNSCIAEA